MTIVIDLLGESDFFPKGHFLPDRSSVDFDVYSLVRLRISHWTTKAQSKDSSLVIIRVFDPSLAKNKKLKLVVNKMKLVKMIPSRVFRHK